ncbi:MAG: hypothetical protein HY927_06550 [Elusimicrobia bacterium]|nr:hypothetical protein [Elusimicrobiota bacterium]
MGPASPADQTVRLENISLAIAEDVKAAADPSLSMEAGQGAGQRIMAAVLGERPSVLPALGGAGAPQDDGQAAPSRPVRRSAPIVADVAFTEQVTPEQRRLFADTLGRRKAGWTRGMAQAGLKLDAPIPPAFKVVGVREVKAGGAIAKLAFSVEWNQGETRVGAFRVTVRLKDLNLEFSRLPVPEPPAEKVLKVSFKKSVTPEDAARFLEGRRLRVLRKDWDGTYWAAVTGGDEARAVAKEVSGVGIVLYASAKAVEIPEERRLTVVFKKSAAGDDDVAGVLRRHGLTVLEAKGGTYVVGVEEGGAAAEAARGLSSERAVFYAVAAKDDRPEGRQLIVRVRETVVMDAKVETAVTEDDVAGLLRRHSLEVMEDLGSGMFRVALSDGRTTNRAAAEALARSALVESAVAVGAAADKDVEGAATGVASYKGRPWSSTEYNLVYHQAYMGLVARGATRAQLELFGRLCDEAPMRGGGFNPWSGD